MIREDYVSFEVAKLLKEKGFDEKCISVYHNGKLQLVSSLGVFCGEGYGEQILTYTNSECEWSPIIISAPTLQMAMKWLREKYNLHIGVLITYQYFLRKYEVHIMHTEKYEDIIVNPGTNFNTNEEACESAIRYTLENLI